MEEEEDGMDEEMEESTQLKGGGEMWWDQKGNYGNVIRLGSWNGWLDVSQVFLHLVAGQAPL